MADLSYHLTLTDTNAVIALISESIDDSMGPDWTIFDAAHHVMQWLTDAGLGIIVLPKHKTDCPASHDGHHHVEPAFECAGYNDGTGFYCPLWGSEECDWECPEGGMG